MRAPNYLENTTPAGTLLAMRKTANYTVVRNDSGRTIVHDSATPHTFTFAASSTLGQDFWCRCHNINTGTLTLTVTGAGNVDCLQNEFRDVFFSGVGTVLYASAARLASALS
jgi:hypothetical protein